MNKLTTLVTGLFLCIASFIYAQDSAIEPYKGGLEKPLTSMIDVSYGDSSSLERPKSLPNTEISPEEGLESFEAAVITPMTRLELPSDEDVPMIRMIDSNGNEYYIRRNPQSEKANELKEHKKYQKKEEKLKAKGVIFS